MFFNSPLVVLTHSGIPSTLVTRVVAGVSGLLGASEAACFSGPSSAFDAVASEVSFCGRAGAGVPGSSGESI
jgi:hypothetical protein